MHARSQSPTFGTVAAWICKRQLPAVKSAAVGLCWWPGRSGCWFHVHGQPPAARCPGFGCWDLSARTTETKIDPLSAGHRGDGRQFSCEIGVSFVKPGAGCMCLQGYCVPCIDITSFAYRNRSSKLVPGEKRQHQSNGCRLGAGELSAVRGYHGTVVVGSSQGTGGGYPTLPPSPPKQIRFRVGALGSRPFLFFKDTPPGRQVQPPPKLRDLGGSVAVVAGNCRF